MQMKCCVEIIFYFTLPPCYHDPGCCVFLCYMVITICICCDGSSSTLVVIMVRSDSARCNVSAHCVKLYCLERKLRSTPGWCSVRRRDQSVTPDIILKFQCHKQPIDGVNHSRGTVQHTRMACSDAAPPSHMYGPDGMTEEQLSRFISEQNRGGCLLLDNETTLQTMKALLSECNRRTVYVHMHTISYWLHVCFVSTHTYLHERITLKSVIRYLSIQIKFQRICSSFLCHSDIIHITFHAV